MQNQEDQPVKDQINSQLESLTPEFMPPAQQKFSKVLVIMPVILFLAVISIFIYFHFQIKPSSQQLEKESKTSVDVVLATPTPAISTAPLSIFTDKYEFGNKIEQEFDALAQDHQGQVVLDNKASVWWIADDDFNIINDNEIGLDYLHFNCGYDPETKETFNTVLDKLSKNIGSIMVSSGFSFNQKNSSKSIDDDQFYYYIQAYEKGETKCTLVISPSCSANLSEDFPMHHEFAFACTESFQRNYQEQVPFLKDLDIVDEAVIRINKRVGDYVLVLVDYRLSGHYVIAQLMNGIWVQVYAGQDIPNCQVMEKYQVPQEIYGECYDEEKISVDGELGSMKRALQDFKRANKDSLQELYYFEGAMMDGDTEFNKDAGILEGSVIVKNTTIFFQLGVDGMGGECETRECISFTSNQGLEFSGVILPNGCNITLAGEKYGNSSFGISDKSVCSSNAKLVNLFSDLKRL